MSWPQMKSELNAKIDTFLQAQAKQLDTMLALQNQIRELIELHTVALADIGVLRRELQRCEDEKRPPLEIVGK